MDCNEQCLDSKLWRQSVMLEVDGDLFRADPESIGLVAITTNALVGRRGYAVMGKGVALQAAQHWPGIDRVLGERVLGERLKAQEGAVGGGGGGNHVHLLTACASSIGAFGVGFAHTVGYTVGGVDGLMAPWHIASFPVKRHWKNSADVELIRRSCDELRMLVGYIDAAERGFSDKRIALPRPGCGAGGLAWSDVREIVERGLPGKRYLVVERTRV